MDLVERITELFFFFRIAHGSENETLPIRDNFKGGIRGGSQQFEDRLVDDDGVTVSVFCEVFNHGDKPLIGYSIVVPSDIRSRVSNCFMAWGEKWYLNHIRRVYWS